MDEASLTEGLRAVSEPLRWRILQLLRAEDLCVCHLVDELAAPQSLISHHLRVLRDAGLVESERFRYWTYYRLSRSALRALGRRLLDVSVDPVPGSGRRPCC
ncbi:MAG: ArsR/SmtB family transcription factor [Acidimicrobiia bacterium]